MNLTNKNKIIIKIKKKYLGQFSSTGLVPNKQTQWLYNRDVTTNIFT